MCLSARPESRSGWMPRKGPIEEMVVPEDVALGPQEGLPTKS